MQLLIDLRNEGPDAVRKFAKVVNDDPLCDLEINHRAKIDLILATLKDVDKAILQSAFDEMFCDDDDESDDMEDEDEEPVAYKKRSNPSLLFTSKTDIPQEDTDDEEEEDDNDSDEDDEYEDEE
jgi:hypothetical protein